MFVFAHGVIHIMSSYCKEIMTAIIAKVLTEHRNECAVCDLGKKREYKQFLKSAMKFICTECLRHGSKTNCYKDKIYHDSGTNTRFFKRCSTTSTHRR